MVVLKDELALPILYKNIPLVLLLEKIIPSVQPRRGRDDKKRRPGPVVNDIAAEYADRGSGNSLPPLGIKCQALLAVSLVRLVRDDVSFREGLVAIEKFQALPAREILVNRIAIEH